MKHLLWSHSSAALWFHPEHDQHNAALHNTHFCLLLCQNSCLPRYLEDTAMKVYNQTSKPEKQSNVTVDTWHTRPYPVRLANYFFLISLNKQSDEYFINEFIVSTASIKLTQTTTKRLAIHPLLYCTKRIASVINSWA